MVLEYEVKCRVCDAEVGKPCTDENGKEAPNQMIHKLRIVDFMKFKTEELEKKVKEKNNASMDLL